MLLANITICSITVSIDKIIRNEIISYTKIFNTVTPANNPLNEKKGKVLHKIFASGDLNKKDIITIIAKPHKLTNSLIAPLLKPITPPSNMKMIIIISTILIESPSLFKLYYIYV